MSLQQVEAAHLSNAAEIIDREGIPTGSLHNYYYVVMPDGREYPFKHLVRTAHRLVPGNESANLDFNSDEATRAKIKALGFEIRHYPQHINFFEPWEFGHFSRIAGKPYRKANEEDKRHAKHLRSLVKKVNLWAEQAVIPGFQYKEDNRWQWSGTFKEYIWIRVTRPKNDYKVFFTLVAKSHGLVLELDCWRSDYATSTTEVLSAEQVNAFDTFLRRSDYKEVFISEKELTDYNWQALIDRTQRFMNQYEWLYDGLVDVVLNPEAERTDRSMIIFDQAPPERTRSRMPKQRSFQGKKNIDWAGRQASAKALGDAGERLVIKMEKEKLNRAGLSKEAERVEKQPDGVGYDIRSFDESGKPVCIEVKTTTASKEEPFYMSANEVAYLNQYPEGYRLYRLYEYDLIKDTARAYVLDAEGLKSAQKEPVGFEVVLG